VIVLRLNGIVPLYPVVPFVLHKTAPPQAVALSSKLMMFAACACGIANPETAAMASIETAGYQYCWTSRG
jgi:hypothetical protein